MTYTLGLLRQPAPVAVAAPEPQPAEPRPAVPAPVEPVSAIPEPPPPPRAAAEPPGDDVSPEERANIRVYQRVNRSVVNITTRSVQPNDLLFLFNTPRSGAGSGSVLDKQGHVLTNFHVIDAARRISITLYDGTSHEAKVVGSDPNNDLAVLRIEVPAEKLFPISWGDSARLQVGMCVYAIGNPFGLERTLTTGIISSLNRSLRTENGRTIRGVIQTDAAINPGNSGGPLLNRRGELVGITTAIISRAGQYSGVGLAIPSGVARHIVAELVRFGRVIRPDCGILTVLELENGLLVAQLAPEGAAERAGLRGPEHVVLRRGGYEYHGLDRSKADIITAVDGKPVKTAEDLLTYIESKKPGDTVTMSVIRQDKKIDVPVALVELRDNGR
jgi:S1-C subfamily serine protease